MKQSLPLFVWFSLVVPIFGQDQPVPAQEAASKFTLPEGFSATLFAGEPHIVQPIAFTFDDRGRMWVVECVSYPKWTTEKEGKDRVVILEDTDGDGKFDKSKVFLNNGRNLSGIEYSSRGIYLCSLPELIFIPIKEGEDKPAGPPQVLLDGWNFKDTKHNIFNSLIWGPDGWLYGLNGIQARSKVGLPGSLNEQRIDINCGVWRYHPVTKKFEAVAHGTTNPFGLDFDEYGEAFITNCVIKHLFHVVPGIRMQRMYGQDYNPYAYALAGSIADYIHWAGGDWTTSRGGKGPHSDFGGGHAHAGCAIYLGDNFPKEYRGRLFTANIHGNRLNSDILEKYQSGYKSRRAPDFLFANDSWFRGICVKTGPDGGLYVSDWCDTGECHNYDKADTTNGRIYRIIYNKQKGWSGNLNNLTNEELLKLLEHPNDWFRRKARRILTERHQAGQILPIPQDILQNGPSIIKDEILALQYVWLFSSIGLQEPISKGLTNPHNSAHVRAWVVRSLSDYLFLNPDDPKEYIKSLENTDYKTPIERLALASAIRNLQGRSRERLVEKLLKVSLEEDKNDHNLPIMSWLALEPLITSGPSATKYLMMVKSPFLRESIARKAVTLDQKALGNLLREIDKYNPESQYDILKGIHEALAGYRELPIPEGWTQISQRLIESDHAGVRDVASSLAVKFGDKNAINRMMEILQNTKLDNQKRISALKTVLTRKQPELLPILKKCLEETSPIRSEAIRALASYNDPETPDLLLKRYKNLSQSEKEDAVQTLAARSNWTLVLLDAVEKGTLAKNDISVFVARQINNMKEPEVKIRLEKVWGQIKPVSSERNQLIQQYKSLLNAEALKKADLQKGRLLYAANCASCHKLHDAGGEVGPALTGAQRSNLDYLLENIVDPSAVVPREYQVTVIRLLDGRTINGIIRSENKVSLVVQTANEKLTIPIDEIDSKSQSKLSIMPEGILDRMKKEEIIDLMGYLQHNEQVPLPK